MDLQCRSDELNCQTAFPTTDSQSSHISCPLNDFMCSDGLCIKYVLISYLGLPNVVFIYWLTESITVATSIKYELNCLPLCFLTLLCQDCADGSDEQECDEQFAAKCRPDEVLCANGQCAPEESSCCTLVLLTLDMPIIYHLYFLVNNAESQCETGSSGECIDQRNECSNGNFRCRDGSCVR